MWDPSRVRDLAAVARWHRAMLQSFAVSMVLAPVMFAAIMGWPALLAKAVVVTGFALLIADGVWSFVAMARLCKALGLTYFSMIGSWAMWRLDKKARWALECGGLPVGLMGVPKSELASIGPSRPSAGIHEPEPSNPFAARVADDRRAA